MSSKGQIVLDIKYKATMFEVYLARSLPKAAFFILYK